MPARAVVHLGDDDHHLCKRDHRGRHHKPIIPAWGADDADPDKEAEGYAEEGEADHGAAGG